MKRLLPAVLPVALLCAMTSPAAVKIVLVGDSTVDDQGGWGTGFHSSLSPEVQVTNLALNGRSSKSFRDEGAWAPALAAKPDYILIQFGHNDGPGKGPEQESMTLNDLRSAAQQDQAKEQNNPGKDGPDQSRGMER